MSELESSTGEELLQSVLLEKRQTWEQAQLHSFAAKGKEPKTDSWKSKYKGPAEPDAEGLYDLPVGWVWASAEAMCESVRDGTHDTPKYVAEGVPLITSKNLIDGQISFEKIKLISREDHEEISKRSGVATGDILFAMIGTVGNPVVVSVDAEFSIKNVGLFKKNKEYIEPRYLRYWLESPALRKWLTPRLKGTTQKFAPLGLLRALPVPVAPREDQEGIVAEIEKQFSRLDEAVASLKRVKANLKRYKSAVLKAAVEGKLTEEWREQNPDVEPASKLLGRILAERRTKWEEIELAKMKTKGKEPKDDKWKEKYADLDTASIDLKSPVPETWCNVAIGQVFEVAVGATPSRREPMYWDGGIPWVSSGEVDFCKITRTRETISAEGLANSSTKMSPIGTVLLGMIGEGKTRGQAAILEIEACNNQNSAAIRVSETEVLPMYLYYSLVSQYEETRRRGSGGNQPALNKSRVQRIAFPLPPVSEQIEIVSKVERLLSMEDAVFNALIKNSRKIRSCRQAFLARAFAGDMLEARD